LGLLCWVFCFFFGLVVVFWYWVFLCFVVFVRNFVLVGGVVGVIEEVTVKIVVRILLVLVLELVVSGFLTENRESVFTQ